MGQRKKLLIIDSSALIHRAYHAIPFLRNKQGEKINAVYGFCSIILKFLKELEPSFIVAAFDLPDPTFRHYQFNDYKAKRPKTPADLSSQMPKTKKLLESFGIPFFERQGFEADDIIGTIARLAQKEKRDLEIMILSGDKDLLQLTNNNTVVYLLGRGVKETLAYNPKKIKEKYQGLEPKQLIDYKALRGDPSDNIPGVKGIGEKAALALISQFKDLETLYKSLAKGQSGINKRIEGLLKEQKEVAFLSRTLVSIKNDIPLSFNLKDAAWDNPDKEKLAKILKETGFPGLVKRLDSLKESNNKSQVSDSKKKLGEKEIRNNQENNLRLF